MPINHTYICIIRKSINSNSFLSVDDAKVILFCLKCPRKYRRLAVMNTPGYISLMFTHKNSLILWEFKVNRGCEYDATLKYVIIFVTWILFLMRGTLHGTNFHGRSSPIQLKDFRLYFNHNITFFTMYNIGFFRELIR